MKVERRILKSVSEFSMFKLMLVIYLIFFILFVIIFALSALIGWAFLAATGTTMSGIAQNIDSIYPGLGLTGILGGLGGGILGIVLFIIIGLVASVFAAAAATVITWIFNVVLKIVGGIELRFAPEKPPVVQVEQNIQQSN
jgi:hypothetical protein